MAAQFESPSADDRQKGVILVDHGSRLARSNDLFEQFVREFRHKSGISVVEAAHMELSEPSIATAMGRCVEQGITRVIICPYFLLPGKHWQQDIPALARQACERYPEVSFLIAEPVGLHPLMYEVVQASINQCLNASQWKK